jgi:hypothetical protein
MEELQAFYNGIVDNLESSEYDMDQLCVLFEFYSKYELFFNERLTGDYESTEEMSDDEARRIPEELLEQIRNTKDKL